MDAEERNEEEEEAEENYQEILIGDEWRQFKVKLWFPWFLVLQASFRAVIPYCQPASSKRVQQVSGEAGQYRQVLVWTRCGTGTAGQSLI
jgi:hypothetical protein